MKTANTIAAIATPIGEASIGVIRISGPEAISTTAKIFQPRGKKEFQALSSHRVVLGTLIDPLSQEKVDQVMCSLMRSPFSYTGEDVVEISAHGNPRLLSRILLLLESVGVRLAARGEFTKRAFLNGKLDLTQAEGVMDAVRALTPQSMKVAIEQVEGGLGKFLKEMRAEVLSILTPIEANIDFPEEEVPEVSRENLFDQVSEALSQIEQVLSRGNEGKVLREGARAIIVGKPNVGKSSLLNALLQEGRAIVTDIPGTTRDTIEEWAEIRGVPMALVDTAGIRATSDKVEQIGIERSKEALSKGDLILVMIDCSSELEDDDVKLLEMSRQKPNIVVLNKIDLHGPLSPEKLNPFPSGPIIPISVKENLGLDVLRSKMAELVLDGNVKNEETPLITRARHQECLERAKLFLAEAKQTLVRELPLDLIALDLRGAAESIGEITGDNYTEDLIEKIFSEFCVGK